MLKLYVKAQDFLKNLHLSDNAQDGFEYLLVIGVVMVAIIGAIVSGLLPETIETFVGDVIEKVTGALNLVPGGGA